MSSYRDRDDRGFGRRSRSRSPDRDRGQGGRDYRSDRGSSRGPYDSHGSSTSGSHGSRGSSDRGRGGRGGRGGSSGPSGPPRGPPLAQVPVPETGAEVPYAKLGVVGTNGKKIMVKANHFLVQSLPTIKIWAYDLRITIPKECQIRGKEALTSGQIDKVYQHAGTRQLVGNNFVFDGSSSGFSPDMICPQGQSTSAVLTLGPRRRDGTENQALMQVRNRGILAFGDFVNFLRGLNVNQGANSSPHEGIFKWLNAVLRKDPAETMIKRPNSSSFFTRAPDTTMAINSSGGLLEAIRGMFQSARLLGGKLTINVDTATSVFWVPNICLIDHICGLTRSARNVLERNFLSNPEQFFSAASRLIGMFVSVRHLGTDREDLKIKFMGWSAADAHNTRFDITDRVTNITTTSSVFDYFNSKYNITLMFPKLPLVHTRRGDLPLEICYSSAGERYKELLQGPETADLIAFASTPGYDRKNNIYHSLERLLWHTRPILQAHGLSIDYNMMRVEARVLDPPTVYYKESPVRVDRGRWNLRNVTLHQPATIQSWAVLYLPSGRPLSTGDIENRFSIPFARGFPAVGINVPRHLPPIVEGNAANIQGGIEDCIAMATQAFSRSPDIIFVLIETSNIPIYHEVKSVADIQFGVATSILTTIKALKGQLQYIANVALKVNVKLGGINSIVREDRFKERRFMILSADTSHPSPAELRKVPPPPAIASLVASFDRNCVQYTAIAAAQAPTDQMIVDIEPMVEELLIRYQSKNGGHLPQSILFVRDGLSESQYDAIKNQEGRAIRNVCRKMTNELMATDPKVKPPKITLVVAIKRHHTRFFPDDGNLHNPSLCDRLGNVTPGTIVENGSGKDFFLVAHAGLICTVRPCHYKLLITEESSNDFNINDLQRIICGSCSTYARATTTVGVFSAIYYSDLVAARAKKHIRGSANGEHLVLPPVHNNLKYTMYWQ